MPAKKKTKKVAKKKVTAKKKVAKKAAKKSPAKKKVAKKKAYKKKVAKKKAAKKSPAKKKVAKKKAYKKKVAKKKAAKKSPAKKKVAKKTAKKTISNKKTTGNKNKKAMGKVTNIKKSPAQKSKPAAKKKIAPYKQKRKNEDYMGPEQTEHFRQILLAWKTELMQEVDRTVHHMQDDATNFPDPNDRATQESEFGIELRTRDRERKLLKKIASALARVEDGSYGFCEETGEEIGLQRLEARPVATLCVEAQERREVSELQYSDRDD